MVFAPASVAGILPEFNPVSVEPGDLLEQDIAVDRSSGMRLEISLLSPPVGARLAVSDDGQLKLQWATGSDLPEKTRLMIQAKNIDTQDVVETGVLQVSKFYDAKAPQVMSAVTGEASEVAGNQKSAVISFNPMSNQIVSSGQIISLQISALSSDDKDPLISIDRVPRNASFDKNLVNGYTFFWETSDSDQGEHVFRVSATHPSQSEVFATALVTMFVGDPSRRTTLPVNKDK